MGSGGGSDFKAENNVIRKVLVRERGQGEHKDASLSDWVNAGQANRKGKE